MRQALHAFYIHIANSIFEIWVGTDFLNKIDRLAEYSECTLQIEQKVYFNIYDLIKLFLQMTI